MDFLFAFNDKYCKHAAALICSIIKTNGTGLNFYILYSSVSSSNINKLTKFVEGEHCNIFFYKVNDEDFKYCSVKDTDEVTLEAYYRILAVKYLPQTVEKCLYLDTDIVVNDNLNELFNLDMKQYAVAAVTGYADAKRKLNLGMDVNAGYFNSGVMLFNFAYWRENNIAEKVMTFIKNTPPEILVRWDQDALNAILVNKWYKLPLKYNAHIIPNWTEKEYAAGAFFGQFTLEEIEEAKINRKIIHYTGFGALKPWWRNSESPYAYLYFYYLSMTPYKVKKLPKFNAKELAINTIKIFNTFDSSKISVVVQGALCEDTKDCLQSIRKYLPKAQIILSTYKDSNTEVLLFDKLVLNDDPGSINLGPNFRPLNVNRQIITTQNGLKNATREYALKIRTDAKMNGTHFAQIFDYANNALKKREAEFSIFNKRIIISSHFTRNPDSDQNGLCFQTSDVWLFGLREDLLDLYDIPFQKEEECLVELNGRKVRKYTPEQYILISCIKKHGFLPKIKKHVSENGEEEEFIDPDSRFDLAYMDQKDGMLILNSNRIMLNNFFILNQKHCGILEPKKFKYHPKKNKNGVMSTELFMNLYCIFYEPNYIIPYIFYDNPKRLLKIDRLVFKLKEGVDILCKMLKTPIYLIRIVFNVLKNLHKFIYWYINN